MLFFDVLLIARKGICQVGDGSMIFYVEWIQDDSRIVLEKDMILK